MTQQTLTREQVQTRLQALREALGACLATRSMAELAELRVTPEWDGVDLLRHMLVWDELGARCLENWQGDRAWLPRYDNEDRFNLEMVAAHADLTLEAIVERLHLAYQRFGETLEQAGDHELREIGAAPWGEQVTRLHLINELAGHDLEHLEGLS